MNDTRQTMKKVLDSCDQFENLVAGNPIFEQRTRSIGIIPSDLGAAYGVSGSNLRSSGVDWDLRRDGRPYGLVYDELDWKVWTHPDGDSFARYWVRLQETRESARMVLQMLDGMPSGPIMAKVPRIIKVPEGEVWVTAENPLGEMGYYIISKGATGPFRVKIRSASFSNVSILPWLLRGAYVPDVITIMASLYFILGDIDR
jgi:NADH-quinone oxidoreductase subunit D